MEKVALRRMEKSLSALRGPNLFAACFGRRPVQLTPDSVREMHREIESKVTATFREIGGIETRPVIAETLSTKADFGRRSQELMSPEFRGRIDYRDLDLLCLPVVSGEKMEYRLLYNLPVLKQSLSEAGASLSDMILNQMSATLYSPWYEKLDLQRNRTLFQLNFASQGWGIFFSQVPLNGQELLQNESVAGVPEAIPILQEVFGYNHAMFVALTLLKLERAEGFDALVKLMRRPPGLKSGENGYELHGVLREFWQIYLAANRKLEEPAMSSEIVFADQGN
jgi:hypothetical protein